MLQFPRFSFSPRRRKTSQSHFFQGLRSALAVGLAALLFLTSLGFTASAQQTGSTGSGSKVPDSDDFIIYQDANGDTVCREATQAEKRELRRINTQNLGLHPITPVKREYDSYAHSTADGQVTDNDVPQKIILLGTAQLDGFPEAKAAFNRAALTWEAQIQSPIKIYIEVDFGTTNFGQAWSSSNILGSTSSFSQSFSYQTVRSSLISGASTAAETSLYNSLPAASLPTNNGDFSSISVSTSIARAMGLINPVAQQTDQKARIGFNSNFQFDFDPSDGISTGLTDFEAVATHEIGHALGFTSRAGGSSTTSPAVLDIFRFRTGTTLSTFGSAQRVMTADGLQYYFDGNPEVGLSTGGPTGDATGGDGNQSSHWKQRSLNGGVYIGIMDPRIPSGTRRQITSNDTNALNSFGYNLDNANPPPPPPPPPAPPANDSFSSPQVISGCTGSTTGTNISATHQSGEPSHDPLGNAGGSSVWYQWQAPATSSVTITTIGSDYDTMLGIYTGSSVNSLTAIVKNDDIDTDSGNIRSSVTFNATGGTFYKIAVDGWGGDTGNIKLNWTESDCQQSPTMQLSASSYSAVESAGKVTLTVTRSDSTTAANVDYTTSDTAGLNNCNVFNGIASSRCDYATTVGTLRFAAGEGSKSIFIPVADDAYAEGTESFTLTLSNPTGASLGTISSATITITDNESVTGVNPVDASPFFVRQHYIDFLGREPDPAGYQGWQNVLAGCGTTFNPPCDRIEVSSGFFRSEEFQTRGYFIYRFYSAVGRIPLYEQFMPDFAKVSGFLSAQQLEDNKAAFVQEFMTRSDFQSRYGAITDPTAYVNALLNTVGLPNHPSKQTWITGLTNGSLTRAQVLRAVVESQEVAQKYNTEAFVIMQYFGYLRRSADGSYVSWINTMNQNGGDYRVMINGFLNSAEYRLRFGP